MNHKAIYKLYPNVVSVDDGTGAFDKDGNKVEIDLVEKSKLGIPEAKYSWSNDQFGCLALDQLESEFSN